MLKRTIKKGLRNYKVTLYKSKKDKEPGVLFVRARTKGEAVELAMNRMLLSKPMGFGKVKSIQTVTEVSKEDIEKYPMFFKSWRNPENNFRRSGMNPLSKEASEKYRTFGGERYESGGIMPTQLANQRAAEAREAGFRMRVIKKRNGKSELWYGKTFRNPTTKSVSKTLLPIAIIGGLVWLISRNK